MVVRFLKNATISDGFTPKQYKEGEVYHLSGLALDFAIHNKLAVEYSDPVKERVSYPSATKVVRPSKKK